MATYTVYRLTFKTQLHLGRTSGPALKGNLGLENTETYIQADTLFSALCQTWSIFYDTKSLTAFLAGYTEGNDPLPFTLTSAFPFAHDVYFFPKPLTFVHPSKKSKHVQFVSRSIFQDIISGHSLDFNENNLINGERVWVSPEESEPLKISMGDELIVWETTTRPRVTTGSRTAGSEIWHIENVQFNKGCGLWFAVTFNSDETKQKIETLLRVLGDTGIGGERNAGYGLFDFDETSIEMPTVDAPEQFVTLSPICPAAPDELEVLLTGDVAYNLNLSGGRMSSAGGTPSRRKQVMMFTEGSVLHTTGKQVGGLVDLKPDNWVHPVYRYGYAWTVGIKGIQNETEIST